MKLSLCLTLLLLPCVAMAQTNMAPAPAAADAQPPPPRPPPDPDKMLAGLTKKLDLTQLQQDKLKPILDADVAKMNALHDDTSLTDAQKHDQMKALHMDLHKQITDVLTPDQDKVYEQMHHHGGPGGGAPPPAQ